MKKLYYFQKGMHDPNYGSVMIEKHGLARAYHLLLKAFRPELNKENPGVRFERDESANCNPFLAERDRKPERDERQHMPKNILSLIESADSIEKWQKENPLNPKKICESKKEDAYTNSYGKGYKNTRYKSECYGEVKGKITEYIIKPMAATFRKLRQAYTKKEYKPKIKGDIKKNGKTFYKILTAAYVPGRVVQYMKRNNSYHICGNEGERQESKQEDNISLKFRNYFNFPNYPNKALKYEISQAQQELQQVMHQNKVVSSGIKQDSLTLEQRLAA